MAPRRMGEGEEGDALVMADSDAMTSREAKDRIKHLDSQLEMIRKELTTAAEEAAKREERLLAELDTTRKLAELYKEKADEASMKSTDLMSIIKTFESHMYQREAQYNQKLQQEVEAREVTEREARETKEKLEEALAQAKEEAKSAKAAAKAADDSAREAAANGVITEQKEGDGGGHSPTWKSQDPPFFNAANKENNQSKKDGVDACRQHLFPGESVSEEDEQASGLNTPPNSETAKDNEDDMYTSVSATNGREYPSDPSLPDIKNSIYGTDEFRMYSFKVRPCSRAYSHDWTECPFVHPGENARRRDPRRYHYSCVPCPDFRKGACRRGDNCEYAHGVFECWLHPAQYRTRLCKDGTSCGRRVCFFAHTSEELRPVYTATGSAIPSPRSASPMDMRSVSISTEFPPMSPSSVLMMSQFSQNSDGFSLPTPPMSPSGGSGPGTSQWSQSSAAPALHLANGFQASRLRAALHARDMPAQDDVETMLALQSKSADLDSERVAEQFAQLSTHARLAAVAASAGLSMSPRTGRSGFAGLGLQIPPSPQPEDYYGDAGQMSSPVRSPLATADRSSQFGHNGLSSPTAARRLNSEQLLQQYLDASIPSHSALSSGLQGERGLSSPVPLSASAAQQSAVAAALNARRSPVPRPMWRERDLPAHMGILGGGLPPQGAVGEWGSPTGKPDWGMQHEEAQMRRNGSASLSVQEEDSDMAWIHRQRMVKDGRSVDSEAAVAAALAASAGGNMVTVLAREKAGERERMLMAMGGSQSWMDQTA